MSYQACKINRLIRAGRFRSVSRVGVFITGNDVPSTVLKRIDIDHAKSCTFLKRVDTDHTKSEEQMIASYSAHPFSFLNRIPLGLSRHEDESILCQVKVWVVMKMTKSFVK